MRLVGSLVLDQDNADFPQNPRLGTMVLKQGSLYAYTLINGIETWFPLFQNLSNAYLHTQVNPTTTWTVNHQLGSTFCWYQIKDTAGNILFESSSENTDANTTVLTFAEPVAGTAIFIGPNDIQLSNINASLINVGDVQITTTGITVGGVAIGEIIGNNAAVKTVAGRTGDIVLSVSDVAGALSISQIGVNNGIAPLDNTGKVSSTYLPSYVDDVLEFNDFSIFPTPGETGKIYVDISTNKIYRWSGSTYIEIVGSPGTTDAVPEGSVNLYYTTARVNELISTFAAAGTVNKADKFSTARTINITGAVVGSAVFDGSTDITITTSGGTSSSSGGGLSSLYASFSGPVTPMIGDIPWYPSKAITFTNVFAYLSANASSTITATIRKNGTPVQTITIPAGQKTSTTAVNIGLTASDYLTIDIVGGSGNNLSLRLDY